MKDLIDDKLIDPKSSGFARDALKLFGIGALMYALMTFTAYNLSIESRLNNVYLVVTSLLSFSIMLIAANGVFWSVKAFMKPTENGVLKYFTLLGNGLLLLIFSLINFANGLDLYREFFM